MPTRVLLEGPAIEPLLAQVHDEYGTSVRIISAEKVRTGGLAGFFAKQRYELSVEVPDPPPGADAAEPADEPATTLEQLLERAQARDGYASGPATQPPTTQPPTTQPPATQPAAPPSRAPAATAARASAGGAESTADRTAAGTPTNPAVAHGAELVQAGGTADGPPAPADPASARADAFATVLAGLGGVGAEQPVAVRTLPGRAQPSRLDNGATALSRSGAGGRAGKAPPVRSRQPTVRPFHPETVTTAAINGATATRVTRPLRSPAAHLPDPAPAAHLPDPAPAGHLSHPAVAAPPGGPSPTARLVDRTPAGPLADLTPDDSLAGLTLIDSLADQAPSVGPAPNLPAPNLPATTGHSGPTGAPPAPVRTLVRRPEPLAVSLLALGLPEPLAALVTGDDSYGQVLAALAALPDPPTAPDRPGEVLIIAGAVTHALPVAQRVAEQLRLDASRLLLAGPSAAGTGIHSARTISGPAEAQRKARRIHRADTPYVVVLDAPVTGMNAHWARDTCDALGATAVWAVVDATRKTADTRNHLRALGDVEAIAVYGTADTGDPASVLHLGVPVVAVDGQPADRHTWAALLCERMAGTGSAVERRRPRGR